MTGHYLSPQNPQAAYCEGKQRFASQQLAAEVGERNRRSGHRLTPYRCAACRQWHLARAKQQPKRALPRAKKTGGRQYMLKGGAE